MVRIKRIITAIQQELSDAFGILDGSYVEPVVVIVFQIPDSSYPKVFTRDDMNPNVIIQALESAINERKILITEMGMFKHIQHPSFPLDCRHNLIPMPIMIPRATTPTNDGPTTLYIHILLLKAFNSGSLSSK
ncbi:hypothetical protein LOD99_8981 [Oopsacas minuta]|uniref:Uncharacterized protein n=1 Tax=Oopsacas minuta TaxID=111878 RepID=A0AAV7JDZ0_9METZ|nr:hypothetical protein LOD99_8981 [Oopsacas minuta]